MDSENIPDPVCEEDDSEESDMTAFRKELESLINAHSKENGSNTPDYILAGYLEDCLIAFDRAVFMRELWYGRDPNTAIVDALDNHMGKDDED
ncbi:MAG: hypothetical protein ACXABY_08830 [Candidatus Thorarchaeota archaeon]|jgi:hypothetical protein